MKLYSKYQMIRNCIASILIGAAVVIFVMRVEIYKITTEENENVAQVTESTAETETENNSSIEEENITSSKAIPVAVQNTIYTQDEAQNINVYEKCNEAVVNITTQTMSYDWFYQPLGLQDSGSGSGSIIDKRGYVVTNVHVIENAAKITISLSDGTSYEGSVVGKDEECDIAVLKFDVPANVTLKTIEFGNSENLKVGQKVIAIGNPFGLERTMTTGIVSGLGRPIQESNGPLIRNMIQTDAAINPGNSGGPLLDNQGRMIGINTIIYSNSGSSSGVGFAIPVSTARRVVSDLIQYGKVNRGIINAELYPVSTLKRYVRFPSSITGGILVSEIAAGSRAANDGLKGGSKQRNSTLSLRTMRGIINIYIDGDIITAIDNITVNTQADFDSALEDKKPGDKVTVTVLRNGKSEKIKITLDGDESSTNNTGKTL
ncbi:MAG: trypsin-like peptidase domain-containing protein [Treponema sp.]|nr:trypsin-like peptidase domain-containing protein [Treponema sp.]